MKRSGLEAPSLVITNRVETQDQRDCKFKVLIVCSLFKNSFEQEAIFTKSKNTFELQFINPKTNPFILFDLSSEVGNKTVIILKSYEDCDAFIKKSFTIQLEKKVLGKDELFYKFRIEEFFLYENAWFDIVYFVTKRSGVVGTYFSKIDNFKIETIIEPRGNICRESIDYSKTKEGVFM